MVLNSASLAIMIALIPVTRLQYQTSNPDLTYCLIFCAVASGLGLIYYVLLNRRIFSNIGLFVMLAQVSKHGVEKEPLTDSSSFESCSSQLIFVAENELKFEDLSEEGRNMHLNATKKAINALVKNQFGWTKQLENLYLILSLASMIYSIYTLAQGDLPTPDQVVLILYVIFIGLINLPVLVVLFIIAISPLLCLLAIVFCCCCKGDNGSQFIDLEAQTANDEQAMKMGGDCAICFMGVSGDRVYVLPCSDKHIFHCVCLRQWVKVKSTCPICRANIPMGDTNRYSQREEP